MSNLNAVKEIYITLGSNGNCSVNDNGILYFDDNFSLVFSANSMEKYYNIKNQAVDGFFKHVRASDNLKDLKQDKPIFKIILNNYEIVSYECINRTGISLKDEITRDRKIYGVYPGIFKESTNFLDNCSEADLFFQIKNAKDKIIFYNEKMLLEKKSEEKHLKIISEAEYGLDYCLSKLSERFDIEKKKSSKTGRMVQTEEVKKWYNDWNDYFNNISDEELVLLVYLRKNALGLEAFTSTMEVKHKEDIIEENAKIKQLKVS